MWEPSPAPLLRPGLCGEESTDGAPSPSWDLSTLPAGAKGGEEGAAVLWTPSLESGEGVKWGELLFQEEEEHWKSLTCAPSPRPPCWAGLLGYSPPSSWVKLGGREVAAHWGLSRCLNSRRNLSFNALESLSWKTVQGLSLQEL